jgi:hypothetical protein
MSMMKHTPGPWGIIELTKIVKFGEDWACIAEVSNPRSLKQGERRSHLVETADVVNPRFREACANASLIAAAPELLEALKACHLQMLQSNNDSEYAMEANELAKAAIRKAEEGA